MFLAYLVVWLPYLVGLHAYAWWRHLRQGVVALSHAAPSVVAILMTYIFLIGHGATVRQFTAGSERGMEVSVGGALAAASAGDIWGRGRASNLDSCCFCKTGMASLDTGGPARHSNVCLLVPDRDEQLPRRMRPTCRASGRTLDSGRLEVEGPATSGLRVQLKR